MIFQLLVVAVYENSPTFSVSFLFTVWACTLFLFVLGADCVRALLKPRYTTCIAFPTATVPRVSPLVREGKELGYHPLPLVNLCCLLPVIFLPFAYRKMASIMIYFITFPGSKVHLTDLDQVPYYLPAREWYLPFSGDQESLLTPTNFQRGLVMTLNCSFITLGLIHSSPWSSVCPSGLSDL